MSNDGYNASESGALEEADPMIGQIIDKRYKITHKLGEGGMGEVYAADHLRISRSLAIKLLRAEVLTNEEAVARFEQEAMTASSIGHQNIIRIEDSGKLDDGRIYLAMELLAGMPFNDLLEEQDIGPERLLNILIQTCHGLQAAHAKNIVHRDMKPENIYITSNEDGSDLPKLLDFGIAKVSQAEGENHLTRTGTIFGTPFYMAPEQALGQTVDSRVDIYAMGVIMYEVFTGEVPFGGESFMGILTQHITAEPIAPSITAHKNGRILPAGVENVIVRAMKKEPNERFQNMQELVEALIPLYRSVAGSGMSTYMEAHHSPTGSLPPLSGGQVQPITGDESSQPYAPMGMAAPGAIPMGPPGTHSPGMPPGTYPPAVNPGTHPLGTHPPGTHPPGTHPPGMHPPGSPTGSYASGTHPQNPAYNTGAAPGDSLLIPATKSRKGIFAILILMLLGAGGAAAWFLTRPANETVAENGDNSSGDNNSMENGVALTDSQDAAPGIASSGSDGGVAKVGVDASGIAVATISDAAVAMASPDAKAKPNVTALAAKNVVVYARPSGAMVYRDGKLLGRVPLLVEVLPGETVSLIFKSKKFKDLQFTIDDSKAKFTAKMERKKRRGHQPDHTKPPDPGPDKPKVPFCKRPGNQNKPHCILE